MRKTFCNRRGQRSLLRALPVLLLPALAACDGILEVDAPTQVMEASLDDPSRASFLVNSAVSTFDCALGAYIVATGEMADLFTYLLTDHIRAQYNRRVLSDGIGYRGYHGTQNCDGLATLGVYSPLQTTRWYTDDVLAKLEGWTDAEVPGNRTALIATAAAYSGYAHVLLGESYCTAAIDGGPEISRQEVWQRGEHRFTRAIEVAQAVGDQQILNMAYVGRARTRLNLENEAGALADARAVAPGFQVTTSQSTANPFRYNIVAYQTVQQQHTTIRSDWRGLEWAGVADPRVAQLHFPEPRDVWVPAKYASLSSPIPIARYEEAQLIIAEIEGGQTAVDIINKLHTTAGLPPFQSTDPEEIRRHVIQERERELFAEGHRLYDMVRLGIPFTPAPGEPFPGTGGGDYGDDTCLPLPPVEYENNPNINR